MPEHPDQDEDAAERDWAFAGDGTLRIHRFKVEDWDAAPAEPVEVAGEPDLFGDCPFPS